MLHPDAGGQGPRVVSNFGSPGPAAQNPDGFQLDSRLRSVEPKDGEGYCFKEREAEWRNTYWKKSLVGLVHVRSYSRLIEGHQVRRRCEVGTVECGIGYLPCQLRQVHHINHSHNVTADARKFSAIRGVVMVMALTVGE